MHDPFEQSLRDMLNASPSNRDDDACLGRVLKTANRQVGAGDLFGLLGRWLPALVNPSAINESDRLARLLRSPSLVTDPETLQRR